MSAAEPTDNVHVVSSADDPHSKDSDVKGTHTVLYPQSDSIAHVQEALVYAKVLKSKVLLRSGKHDAHNGNVDGTGSVVINMKAFSDITIHGNEVKVGVAVTTVELAAKLTAEKLFLPLDGNPAKSVFSNALSEERGVIGYSAGLLKDYVLSFEGITTKDKKEFTATKGTTQFSEVFRTPDDFIITKLVLLAKKGDDDVVKMLKMAYLNMPYSKDRFRTVLNHLLSLDKNLQNVPDDLTVRVFSGAYGMPMYRVLAATKQDTLNLKEWLEGAVLGAEEKEQLSKKVFGQSFVVSGLTIVDAIVNEGKDCTYPLEESRMRYATEQDRDSAGLTRFLNDYCFAIDRGVGGDKDGIHVPDVKVLSTVHLLFNDNKIGFSVSVYGREQKDARTGDELRLRGLFASIMPNSGMVKVVGTRPVALAAPLATVTLSRAAVTLPVPGPILGFKGKVMGQRDAGYQSEIQQYATSSYLDQKDRMMPRLVGCPKDVDDVITFVKYALQQKCKVVARSGGHQYCGLSSGGNDTMLLTMKDISHCNGEKPSNIVNVGPGALLTVLAAKLKNLSVTIPHGECPHVGIGGHVQTGGFGHIMRGYGLALDYVKSFDIVLVDNNGDVSMRTIHRPTAPMRLETSPVQDQIYYAVMGGGPGSFGIITNIEFECIRDSDHPYSVGYKKLYFYEKSIFKAAMKKVKEHTEGVVAGTLAPDLDMMFSAMSGSQWNPTRPQCVLVEMVHGNVDGTSVPADVLDKDIKYIDDEANQVWNSLSSIFPGMKGYQPLSKISDEFVRRDGMTTDGREFKFPYIKRLNCTKKAITDDFVDKFTNLVDEAMTGKRAKGVSFVFQMVMGGGAYKKNGDRGITSIPHRDCVLGIVFDTFYEGEGGKANAKSLQEDMEKLLESFTGEMDNVAKDIRMTWGSYGDIYIAQNNLWLKYYGNEDHYQLLQGLKQKIDPKDIFTTPFTVQMPTTSSGGSSTGNVSETAISVDIGGPALKRGPDPGADSVSGAPPPKKGKSNRKA